MVILAPGLAGDASALFPLARAYALSDIQHASALLLRRFSSA